jgi:hypothetical protein
MPEPQMRTDGLDIVKREAEITFVIEKREFEALYKNMCSAFTLGFHEGIIIHNHLISLLRLKRKAALNSTPIWNL